MNKLTIIHETDEGVEKVTYFEIRDLQMDVKWTASAGIPLAHEIGPDPSIDLVELSFIPLPNEDHLYGHLEKADKETHVTY